MKWVFNSQMVWGAILGGVFFLSCGGLLDTFNHQGPGYLFYEEPDRSEKVSESEYKRNGYTMNGFMLIFTTSLWITIAHSIRKHDKITELKEEYLKAQIKTLNHYVSAILRNINYDLGECLKEKAQMDENHVQAKAQEMSAWQAHHLATKPRIS